MLGRVPESVIFICDDAAVLSPMCAAVLLAFSEGRPVSLSTASKELTKIHPLAEKVCSDFGIEITNHLRAMWSDKLCSDRSPDLVVALTPGAQHLALEATRNQHIDIEYWPLHHPDIEAGYSTATDEKKFIDLIEQIRGRMVERFGVGTSWEDISSLPGLKDEPLESSEAPLDDHLTQAERVALVKESLKNRPVEISAYLNSLKLLIEDKIGVLESHKPNDPAALEEWQTWMEFLLSLHRAVAQLALYANDAVSKTQSTEVLAEKTQDALDVYKRNFLEWPRENVKDVVDGTFRASLVGCCAIVGGLFGQPVAGALIGSAIFGGPKVGKAIGDAIKSGTPAS